ncbi:hypothetical protein ACIA7S_28315 [Streptomyces sp. NPDC051643]|uniref:hypothetical protein n=1 Tax=Streptomyces sp. NPDC051643 TaxID=3365665 RepID=UPI0037893480
MPATPYVTAAEFAAHPTYLDLDDLRSGIADPEAQVAELTNLLLISSAWADNQVNQATLVAHQVVLSTQGRVDRDGTLVVFPSDRPVLSVEKVAFGATFTRMTAITAPVARVDKNQTIRIPAGRGATMGRVDVDITYTAGWVSTLLKAAADSGAESLTVADPTGIMPGASYRLWEPGREEMVTVSPTWTPPAVTVPLAPVEVPLAAPTAFAHDEGAGWSGMPEDMRLAVVNYTVAQLMRPDTASEDAFPDTSMPSSTRKEDTRKDGSGLVVEAARILSSYARRM